MTGQRWMPGIVPYGADETMYLVVDRFGAPGGYRETEIERSDFESVVSELMSGQFNCPVRVVQFNTLEHWSKDVSVAVAEDIQIRCDIEHAGLPEYLRDFVEGHHSKGDTARTETSDLIRVASCISLRQPV